MKRGLIFLLAMLFVMSSVLLVACNANVVKITLKDVPAEVTQGDVIDYSAISIDVEYDDGTTENIKLTDGVKYNNIDTSTTGNKTLTVSYMGKSDQKVIKVVPTEIDDETVTVVKVDNPEGYREYLRAIEEKEDDAKETEFYNREVIYTVGNDNGYVFVPEVTALDENTGFVTLTNVKTTYKLYVKSGEDFVEASEGQLETYLSNVDNNVYYFTKAAAESHEIFKLEVTLSEDYNAISGTISMSVSQVFEVVNGYNVYDALGLSVLDNKNIKSWASIKETALAWDNGKKLNEFGDVEQVVIHNNITVTANDLPDNYFWHVGDEAKRTGSMSYATAESLVPATLKDYLPGSLKEAWLGEDWEKVENDTEQRGLYVSNGIGISGNCLMLTYDSNANAADKSEKGIYIVHDYKQTTTATNRQYPESHYSFVVYTHASADKTEGANEREANIKGTRTIKNVYFAGQTQKTDDVSNPVGLMMLSADISGLKIINTISTQWYCNAQLDGVGMGTLKLEDCKFYESFSQMVFCWGIPTIDVTHCEMKRAGGPLFIIQTQTNGTNRNSVVTIDDTSNMESWLTGAETWFDINNLPSATVEQLFEVGTLSDMFAGTHYKDADGKVNLIAVVIPDPGDVFDNQKAIPGTLNVGEYTYAMQNSVFATATGLSDIATTGVNLIDTTLAAATGLLGSTETAMLQQLKAGFASMPTNAQIVSLKVAPIYQCGNAYGLFNGTSMSSMSAVKNDSYMQLYGGVKQVIPQIEALIAGLQQMGQDTTQAEALKAEWEALATQLGQVGELEIDDTAWATSWTAGTLAFWVNPGGLDAKNPDLTLKHFMVLFGECAVA